MKLAAFFLLGSLIVLNSLPAVASETVLPEPIRFSVEHMDRTVDPGKDFYRYACGNWLKSASIPEDEVSWSPTVALIRRNALQLREILERAQTPSPERTPRERQVGDFYAAALDQQKVDALGFDPIKPDLEKIERLGSLAELPDLLAEFHMRGISAVFEVWVDADQRKSDVYALEVGQGGLNLPGRDYYLESRYAKERVAYADHIRAVFQMSGRPAGEISGEVQSVLKIETALAKACKKLEDLGDPVENYHKMSRAELLQLAPSFGWEKYWNAGKAPEFKTLIVGQPKFFKALETQLRERSIEEWKAYFRWCVLHSSASLLHREVEAANFAFYGTVLQGQPEINPRWKRAIHQVDVFLGEALGQLYVDRHFPLVAKQRAQEMVNNLTAVYRKQLAKVAWMKPETRKQAVEKFDRFGAKIGAPEKPRDYSELEIRRDDYFGNVQRAAQSEWRRVMARVGGPVDKREWEMTAPTVNAYFKPTGNEIVFPAGILQPPFFDPQLDDAVNYGATGATIGHEMTHGYDNDGRKYDAEGNLRDWWKKADAAAFESRTGVLVEQFNRFTPLPKLHVNGRLTLAENIADLGGLHIAYLALERALEADPSKRQVIDGFTPEQRFFISYAQSWAAVNRPESVRSMLSTDSHAPDTVRGYAPLLHLQEFYDAFGIKKGAPLYLPKERRALIW